MVSATLVAAVAPRNAEARHHGSGIGLVLMGTQHDRRNEIFFGQRWRHVERHRVAFTAFGMPGLPWRDVLLQQTVERLQEAADRQCRRRFGAAPETKREHDAARKLGYQRDIPWPGALILPGHPAVMMKILPTIAAA